MKSNKQETLIIEMLILKLMDDFFVFLLSVFYVKFGWINIRRSKL